MKPFKLDNHPKIKAGFIIPEDYFSNVQSEILQQIQIEAKVVPMYHKPQIIWYAAAAVLALALSLPAINTLVSQKNQPDTAALDNYFAYHADLSDDQIVELLNTEEIGEIKIDYQLDDAEIEEALSGAENNLID